MPRMPITMPAIAPPDSPCLGGCGSTFPGSVELGTIFLVTLAVMLGVLDGKGDGDAKVVKGVALSTRRFIRMAFTR